MSTLHRAATWLTFAAVLFVAVATEAQAQVRVVRSATVVRPVNPGAFRPAVPAQPFPTVGNPQWYRYTNWSGYSNPNNYVNYSNLYAATNPFGYNYYPNYGYNPYAYNPYAYNPYSYGGYNPYAYVPNPYSGYALPY